MLLYRELTGLTIFSKTHVTLPCSNRDISRYTEPRRSYHTSYIFILCINPIISIPQKRAASRNIAAEKTPSTH